MNENKSRSSKKATTKSGTWQPNEEIGKNCFSFEQRHFSFKSKNSFSEKKCWWQVKIDSYVCPERNRNRNKNQSGSRMNHLIYFENG